MTFKLLLCAASLALALASPANAGGKRPAETVTPQFRHEIPNIPGKSLIAVVVDYPPGGASPSHRHAASAFIYANVLSGQIRSQVDSGPARVYRTGESWFEAPGARHTVSENASRSRPAKLLAVFVVDSGDDRLVLPDQQ
jgi:quercetin dioxygenase-like cupin family protein